MFNVVIFLQCLVKLPVTPWRHGVSVRTSRPSEWLLPTRTGQRRSPAVRWPPRPPHWELWQTDIAGGPGELRQERIQRLGEVWPGVWGRECGGESGEAWRWSEQIRNTGEGGPVPNCYWYTEGRGRIQGDKKAHKLAPKQPKMPPERLEILTWKSNSKSF